MKIFISLIKKFSALTIEPLPLKVKNFHKKSLFISGFIPVLERVY